MTSMSTPLFALPFLFGCASPPSAPAPAPVDAIAGWYTSAESELELHRGPEGALRGYVRAGGRVAALASIASREGALHVTATQEDGTRAEMDLPVLTGPAPMLKVEGLTYRRIACEAPADATTRREVEAAYAKLALAVETRDFAAFQAVRMPAFATIPPDGTPSPGSRMAERARGLLERIQPPITTRNDILELTVRGDHAIATVRQTFSRRQRVQDDPEPHLIRTEVTQRETWTRTPEGWKLLFVDEVRDHVTFDNGKRIDR